MKKIFITILLAALMPFAAGAQDARQRTAETIVADALAQLPAQTPKAFDSLMQELAATGADGIRMMAAMLVPAAEGKNAPVEYAINGVVSYVTAAGREELAREIRAGLTDAVAASTDKPNQAFLLSQLQLCATAAEAPVFVKYAADEYLADYASPETRAKGERMIAEQAECVPDVRVRARLREYLGKIGDGGRDFRF